MADSDGRPDDIVAARRAAWAWRGRALYGAWTLAIGVGKSPVIDATACLLPLRRLVAFRDVPACFVRHSATSACLLPLHKSVSLEREALKYAPFYNKTKQAKTGNKTIDINSFFFARLLRNNKVIWSFVSAAENAQSRRWLLQLPPRDNNPYSENQNVAMAAKTKNKPGVFR
jgi:hypothetical protein